MVSAAVATNDQTIAVTFSEAVVCPTTFTADWTYFSAGTTSGGTVTSCTDTSADVLTLGEGGTPFTTPTATATVVYTAPASPTAVNSVTVTGTSVYAATQTLSLGIPFMVSAVVTPGTSIAITYNEGVSCPTTFTAGDFAYDYTFGLVGGADTACAASGDVLTLSGAFNAPLGSATITYTQASPTTADAVFAGTATAPVFELTGNSISGAVITG